MTPTFTESRGDILALKLAMLMPNSGVESRAAGRETMTTTGKTEMSLKQRRMREDIDKVRLTREDKEGEEKKQP
jgi:hypothetical protein